MHIEKVDWDSNFFGYNVGQVLLSNTSSFQWAVFQKESKAFKLVYVFSEEKLNYPHLQLMDEKIVFQYTLNFPQNKTFHKSISSFKFSEEGFEQLKHLALESGIYSRFNKDENFQNDEFQRMYLQWIENLVIKTEAFEIIVYLEDNEILGFASLNKKELNTANIGLVAVNSKARGMGIGFHLIEGAVLKASLHGLKSVEVVTQLENKAAVGLYKKCDFKIKSVTNIYHYWNL